MFGVSHVGGDMTGFEDGVSLSTLIAKPKKSQCGCGVVGVGIQSNAGVECCAPTSFFSTSDDDDDNATFSSPSRILSFVGLSIFQV